MAGACGEPASRYTQDPSFSSNSNDNDGDSAAGGFECNICFELPHDPVVTLCGHLFCWPCLHKWLHLHAQSTECPVCKAIVREDKLVPLYGRGRTATDPRSKPVPGVDVPPRPTGMRPENAPPREANYFPQPGFGFMDGFPHPQLGAARMTNLGFIAGFGGLFPSLFNFHVQSFPNPAVYAAPSGLAYGFGTPFHGGHANRYAPRADLRPEDNSLLTTLFLLVGAFVIFALLFT